METANAVVERGYGYNQAQSRVIGGATKAVNPSCFSSIEDASRLAVVTASRVDSMVDRLSGSVPTPTGTDPRAEGSCLFAAAEQHASNIRESMNRIQAALDRLEKHLP